MGNPVVHFEIIGPDPSALRRYYGKLFGWSFDTPSLVAKEVSAEDQYRLFEECHEVTVDAVAGSG